MGPSARASARLRAKTKEAARRERLRERGLDNVKKGQPHKCQVQGCTKSAVH